MGRKEEAIALLKRAIEINSDFKEAYNALGSLYIDMKNYKEAIRLLEKAIMIDSDYAQAHNNLAVAYYYEKEYDLAIKHCDKALALGCSIHPKFLEALQSYRNQNIKP